MLQKKIQVTKNYGNHRQIGNPRLQVRFLREDHIFALLVLSSCRSGGSSLPPLALALVAFSPEARKTIEQKIKPKSTFGRKSLAYERIDSLR